jgi:hypothetical protein
VKLFELTALVLLVLMLGALISLDLAVSRIETSLTTGCAMVGK